MKTTLFGVTLLLLASCASDSKSGTDSIKNDSIKKDSVPVMQDRIGPSPDMEPFHAIEQVEFSIPMPLLHFMLNEARSDTRGKYVFEHKSKKNNEIVVHGMFRDDETVSLADYFINSYITAEEEGKVVSEKGVVEKNNCFFAKGYWSNKIYESRFVEVTWLRKSDVVVFEANFDIADTTIWNERLEWLLKSDSKFKE